MMPLRNYSKDSYLCTWSKVVACAIILCASHVMRCFINLDLPSVDIHLFLHQKHETVLVITNSNNHWPHDTKTY